MVTVLPTCLPTPSMRFRILTLISRIRKVESESQTVLLLKYLMLLNRHVWLKPVFTIDPTRAATAFDVLIQPYQDSKLSNLAKGTGNEFRYVVPRADRKLANKIVEVGLLRSERPVKSAPSGWDGYSVVNILNGRSKSFLHLVWKTVSTNSWYIFIR